MSERYVCPENHRPVLCRQCGQTGKHVREELVPKGGKVPECEVHGVALVPVRSLPL